MIRRLVCILIYGGHELYLAWTPARLFQRCSRCQYETPGWHVPASLRYRSTWRHE